MAATGAIRGMHSQRLSQGGSKELPMGGSSKTKVRGSKVVTALARIEEDLKEKEVVEVPWIKTSKADAIFGVVILANAAFIGIDLEFAPDGFSWGFWCVETVFLIVFFIELIMRFVAECPKPW